MIKIEIEEHKVEIEALDEIIKMLQRLRDVIVCGKCQGMDVVDGVCDMCNGTKKKSDRYLMYADFDKIHQSA